MVDDASDLGVFALPGTRALVGGADTFFVPAYGEKIELAMELAAFMISRDAMTIRAEQGGKLLPRSDVPISAYPSADQDLVRVLNQMEATIPDMDDAIGGDWQTLFWDQLRLLWVEPGSLDDVLTKLQDAR